MLRIVDIKLLERDNKRSAHAGDIAQPAEAGGTVLEAEVLSYVRV